VRFAFFAPSSLASARLRPLRLLRPASPAFALCPPTHRGGKKLPKVVIKWEKIVENGEKWKKMRTTVRAKKIRRRKNV